MSFDCFQNQHACFRYDNLTNQIILYRCVYRDTEILDVLPIEDFLKVDVYDWALKNYNRNPVNHNFSCIFQDYCDFEEAEKTPFFFCNSISQACNLKCPMCFVGKTHKDTKEMKDAYFHVIESLKGRGLYLRLTDHGEPLVYIKQILKFLETCQAGDFFEVHCATNAQLLNEEYIKRLAGLPFPFKAVVSLDTLNKETYKKIRGNDKLDLVLDNIKLLSKYGLLYGMEGVIQPINQSEVFELKKFAKSVNSSISFISLNNGTLHDTEYNKIS